MASVATARRRTLLRVNAIARRKRKDSHRGYPDLHQTHTIAIGTSDAIANHFDSGDMAGPVTFKFRVDRTSDSATGTVLALGNESTIGFDSGDLEIFTGGGSGDTFTGTFIGAPRDSAEVVVALHPSTGQVRAWVDSVRVIAGTVSTYPWSWAATGTLDYDGISGLSVRQDLYAYVGQIPRHFFEVSVGGAGSGGVVFDDLLFRASRQATDLATSRFPYMERPD